MKKLMIAAAAVVAVSGASFANAAGTILFDPDGAGGASGTIAVDIFDWAPGNALVIGASSTSLPGNSNNVRTLAQSALSIFSGPGGAALPIGQLTFQADFFELAAGLGTSAASFSLGTGPTRFTIYYNPTVVFSNITGLGYDAGTAILQGTITSLTGVFNNTNINAQGVNSCGTIGTNCGLLDQFNADNQNGVRSNTGNGSTSVQVDVTFADSNFFKSNVTSLTVDLQDVSNNSIPFLQADPSNVIVGQTPVYSVAADGTKVNGLSCLQGINSVGQTELGVAVANRCDLHLQTDGATSFNPTATVPEPGSLALVGIALGGLGFAVRRRRA